MRWLIAGYGDVVVRRALPALRELDQAVLGVWGRREGRARAVADQFGIARAGSTLDEMLAGVDAVYVATPVVAHVPIARRAVRAGKHVLIEKPVAAGLSGPESQGLADVARQRGCVVGVAYYRRLAASLAGLRAFLAGLPPGRAVRRIDLSFHSVFSPGPADPMWWRTDRAISGGGVLADGGSHRLDLLCWFLGEPAQVRATFDHQYAGGAERSAHLELTWACGAVADLRVRWAEAEPGADVIRLRGPGWQLCLDPLDLALPGNSHVALFDNFRDAVEQGVEPACPLTDGLLVDRIIVAAQRSHTDGGAPYPP